MKTVAWITGMMISAAVFSQNVKLQTKKNGTAIKVKETPAKAHHTQVKTGDTKVQIINNPSGTKIKIKNHPHKGKKK